MSFNQSIFRNSVYFLVLIPIFAVWGFWVTYFTRPPGSYNIWEHVHGLAMFAWCIMLVAQSFLIRTNHRSVHRALGKISYILAPLIVISTLFLANYKLNVRQLNNEGLYIFGLQIFIIILFAIFYTMAIVRRKKSDVHARWMICTAFTMLDPIFARIIAVNFYQVPFETGVIQWMTFAFIDVIVIFLVIKDWKSSGRRDVFLPALALLAVAQTAMLTVWDTATWKAFAGWFAGLPLT
ncbi:MAG TPA: hypothetical protein VJ984_03495 [Xanthomonadales bacterium]|nr:hypothetical protein [Xanthomonadales bacterium]